MILIAQPDEEKQIKSLEIRNFKSIKEIKIEANQFNLFIGEPNSGKSNIIEAINCISLLSDPSELTKLVRINSMSNLFYNDLFDNPISFNVNKSIKIDLTYDRDRYIIKTGNLSRNFGLNGSFKGGGGGGLEPIFQKIKFYKYNKQKIDFTSTLSENLLPIDGDNLFSLIYNNKKNRERLTQIVDRFNLRPVYRPQEKKIEFQKTIDDELINLPMELLSDTVRTIIFHTFAIESNKDSILVFEEPESHTFPYYTKHLGELVAMDKTNQYFLVTHNPYFLTTIIEQAPKDRVNVFVTYMENYETKIKLLTELQKSELLEFDPFLNLKQFIEEDSD